MTLARPGEPQVVVCVTDEINPTLAGHDGYRYISPPQTPEAARTLVCLLLGQAEPPVADNDEPTSWRCAIAGGQRTVALITDGAGS